MSELVRLNYIGSKHQLYEFIKTSILDFTKYESFENKVIGDLFSGTGIISYYLRNDKAIVISNDTELYSNIIVNSMNNCVYNEFIQEKIDYINKELENIKKIGFITKNYSPYEECSRMFYTIENAKIIDGIRFQIEEWKKNNQITQNDYNFLLASLLVSADQYSNIPAVYGCYLKKFKEKALKNFVLKPIHKNMEKANAKNKTLFVSNESESMKNETFDVVYCDPPYNERQYSKNYFVLNMIALYENHPVVKGVTGIPENSYISPFCQKKSVKKAFEDMVQNINSKYIFISYSSEGLISKDDFVKMLEKYGKVEVYEKEYKRFKSFDYNTTGNLMEYIFSLEKETPS
jgi:adenine-specific DNA-methyltransferase